MNVCRVSQSRILPSIGLFRTSKFRPLSEMVWVNPPWTLTTKLSTIHFPFGTTRCLTPSRTFKYSVGRCLLRSGGKRSFRLLVFISLARASSLCMAPLSVQLDFVQFTNFQTSIQSDTSDARNCQRSKAQQPWKLTRVCSYCHRRITRTCTVPDLTVLDSESVVMYPLFLITSMIRNSCDRSM